VLSRHFIVNAGLDEVAAAGARPVGLLAHTAVRVEMGEPVMGVDVDEATIPQEAGLETDAVSFTKGCYLGQELVARIDSRGHVNRHLRGVVLAENALPPDGADVMAAAATVGSITSVSESLQVGAPIGLGLIRREVDAGTAVEIRWPGGSAKAEVRALPLI
jgi:folate-binding protein YgfZ